MGNIKAATLSEVPQGAHRCVFCEVLCVDGVMRRWCGQTREEEAALGSP